MIREIFKMNGYERVMCALNRETPDIVPIFEIVGDHIRKQVCPFGTVFDMYELLDIDAIWVCEDQEDWQEYMPNIKRDHFGVLRDLRLSDGATFPFPFEPLIHTDEDLNQFLENYKLPDPAMNSRFVTLREIVKRFKNRKAIVFAVWSSFLYPSFVRGFDDFLIDYYENADFVLELAKRFSSYYAKQIEVACDIGADIVMESEDFCGKNGPFMSLNHFKTFCMPGLALVRKTARECNMPFIKHSDGNVWTFMDSFVNELKIDAFHPSEPIAGMKIEHVKEEYGDKIAVIGNIDCSHLLPYGTEEEIDLAVKKCIEDTAAGGGYILSSSNCIHAAVPYNNLNAMIKSARKYGKY
jgi:uroporphyrinogen decarboxylase